MSAPSLSLQLQRFPWRAAVQTLVQRFRGDRLGITASSLTFTTIIALVPFFAVALAVFSAFPIFGKVQGAVQAWLVQSLVPELIARQVLGYMTQFAGKAGRLGVAGLGALFVTALALVLTIDRTLNGIWQVRRPRPVAQRILVYWAAMTLGPLLVGASLSITSYVLSGSRSLVSSLPDGVRVLLDVVEFAMLSAGLAALYLYVPHTHVRRAHAWTGAAFAAAGITLAKALLTSYLKAVPTVSVVYGAFATVPILLIWIYVAWVVVLLGAVLAASLPALLAGAKRRGGGPGWSFQLALELLRELRTAGASEARGLGAAQLGQVLRLDPLQLETVLETLVELGWIGRLNEVEDKDATRYVLLIDADATPVDPLVRQLLLAHSEPADRFWQAGRIASLRLSQVL